MISNDNKIENYLALMSLMPIGKTEFTLPDN